MASIVKRFNKKWMVEVASCELQSVAVLATRPFKAQSGLTSVIPQFNKAVGQRNASGQNKAY